MTSGSDEHGPNQAKPGASSLGWSVESTQYLHRSQWHDVRQERLELPGGRDAVYTYVEHPGSVFVVPFDERMNVLLIRSYRYTIDRYCWEVVAGGLGDRPGVEPSTVARDELLEELGARCEQLVPIGDVWFANGFADYRARMFAAFGVRISDRTSLEPTEVISEVRSVTIDECNAMLRSGEITDGESALALRAALDHVLASGNGADA